MRQFGGEGNVKGVSMSRRMYGVVLWADCSDHKAVIWCEDHGDLAYYHDTTPSAHDGVALDAGDLVEFDLSQEKDLRYARNPERIVRQQYAGIAQRLRSACRVPPRITPVREKLGQVVPFRLVDNGNDPKEALRA